MSFSMNLPKRKMSRGRNLNVFGFSDGNIDYQMLGKELGETLNASAFAASETKSVLMINVSQPVGQIASDKDKQLGYLLACKVACPSGIEEE